MNGAVFSTLSALIACTPPAVGRAPTSPTTDGIRSVSWVVDGLKLGESHRELRCPRGVGAENSVTSCDLQILVEKTAEPVSS